LPSRFKIKPETLLWANYDLLNDNPDLISMGMELKILQSTGYITSGRLEIRSRALQAGSKPMFKIS